jgi:hypothetical protein
MSLRIRHLAAAARAPVIAAAELERVVSVWDLESGRQVSRFDTVLDSAAGGASVVLHDIGEPAETSFCCGGDWLLTSHGDLFDLREQRLIRRLLLAG